MSHIESALQELQAAHDLGEDPPYDTPERALWRVNVTMRAFYDGVAEQLPDVEPDDTPLRDLLTDLVHWAAAADINIDWALDRAKEMAAMELTDWAAEAER